MLHHQLCRGFMHMKASFVPCVLKISWNPPIAKEITWQCISRSQLKQQLASKLKSWCLLNNNRTLPKLQRWALIGFAFPAALSKGGVTAKETDKNTNPGKTVLSVQEQQKKLLSRSIGTFALLFRICGLCIRFIPLFLLYPLTYLSKHIHNLWWLLMLKAIEHAGPTFVKLGQWASTRRDLFSEEFCDRFERLHRRAPAHSWFITKKQLRKVFGKRWRDIFVKIDKRPLGSGCVAQVHKAYMNPDYIEDESIIMDAMDTDEDDNWVDFAEGLEILGFGHIYDKGSEAKDYLREKFQIPSRKNNPQPLSKVDQKQNSQIVDGELSGESSRVQGISEEVNQQNGASQTAVSPDGRADQADPSQNQPADTEEDNLIPVAIKIVHPGIYRHVSRDLAIIRTFANILEYLIPGLRWISLNECVEEFAFMMTQQTDLRFEAECLEQFVENFEHIPNVRFPRPIRPFCQRRVLVETYEEGVPVSDFVKNKPDSPEGLQESLADIGVQALLKMVFEDNFVHGDLHPGNILVQNAEMYDIEEETKSYLVDVGDTVIVGVKAVEHPLRLIMLDTGISVSLNAEDFSKFKAVFTAVVLGDGEKVADLFLNHSHYQYCQDVEAFKSEMTALVNKAREQTVSLRTMQVGTLLHDVFSMLSRHRIRMESNFATIMLAIFVLEGLGRSLDPEIDLLDKAKYVLL